MKQRAIAIVEQMEKDKYPVNHDKFRVGDTIKIEYMRQNLKDQTKKDKFTFEGIVTGINNRSHTIRVSKSDKDTTLSMVALFPLNSPDVKVILVSHSKRRQRSKAYYLEKLSGRKAAMKIIK